MASFGATVPSTGPNNSSRSAVFQQLVSGSIDFPAACRHDSISPDSREACRGRPYHSSRTDAANCPARVQRTILQKLQVAPSVLVWQAGRSRRRWNSRKEWWGIERSKTVSLTTQPSLRARIAGNGSIFQISLKEYRMIACSGTPSLTMPPAVLVRRTRIGSRPWLGSSPKGCCGNGRSEALSLTTLPSGQVIEIGFGSSLWSSPKTCWGIERNETLSLTILPAGLVRNADNSSWLWSSSEACCTIEHSETSSLTMPPLVLEWKAHWAVCPNCVMPGANRSTRFRSLNYFPCTVHASLTIPVLLLPSSAPASSQSSGPRRCLTSRFIPSPNTPMPADSCQPSLLNMPVAPQTLPLLPPSSPLLLHIQIRLYSCHYDHLYGHRRDSNRYVHRQYTDRSLDIYGQQSCGARSTCT